MRITLLSYIVLALTAANALAQTQIGLWHPRPTIGLGFGGLKAITRNGETNAELQLSERLSLDAEFEFHGFRDDPWYQRSLITGETMIRLKVGL